MSKHINDSILERLRRIAWLSEAGSGGTMSLPTLVTSAVKCHTEAVAAYRDHAWEDTTLAAHNRLTSYLAERQAADYSGRWNLIAKDGRDFIRHELDAALEQARVRNGFDNVFLDCVRWDQLASIHELSFARHRPPTFFTELLLVYEMGRFPCGWEGEWPSGQLMVY